MGEITKLEFCERFVAEIMTALPIFDGTGTELLAYADAIAPTYWDAEWQREDGPEACVKSRTPPMTADTYNCDICAEPINEGDMCLRDIDLGDCHAECLEGSPMVDLDTGEPLPEGAPKPEPYPWRGE